MVRPCTRTPRTRRFARSVSLLAALALVACGGESAPTASAETTTVSVVASNNPGEFWPSGVTRTFSARWTRAGSGWIYDAVLVLRNDGGRVSGQIQWTLVAPDMREAPGMAYRVGASATEFVTGFYSSGEGRMELAGTGVTDETLISTDTYRLSLSAGGTLSGQTITNDMDWSGSLVGRAM